MFVLLSDYLAADFSHLVLFFSSVKVIYAVVAALGGYYFVYSTTRDRLSSLLFDIMLNGYCRLYDVLCKRLKEILVMNSLAKRTP